MKGIKRGLTFLIVFAVALNAGRSISEDATLQEPLPDVIVCHMVQTLSGGYEAAQSAKEKPNPEYRAGEAFSGDLNSLSRKYPGFTSDEVKITRDENGNIVSADVFYTRNSYVLIVEYIYEDGETAYETYTQSVLFEAEYAVSSPEILLYSPSQALVSGTMGTSNQSYTVVYTKNEDEPEEPSTPSEPDEPATPSTPSEPDEPATPSTPTEPDEPATPSTPTEPDEPATPSIPTEPDEPATPSTPSEPDEPATPSTPSEPDEPATPSTPSEPDEPAIPSTPTEPATPVEPGGRPGGIPSGGRNNGRGQTETKVNPGEAATSYHSMGTRDLNAHWYSEIQMGEERLKTLMLDDASAVIGFAGTNEDDTFIVESAENGEIVLSAMCAGTWDVNGFALKILKESGYEALVLKTSASTVWISTDAAAQGDTYKSLKAQGVGERRMVYRYSITQSGDCVFTLLADGKTLEAEGIYTVAGKEDGV